MKRRKKYSATKTLGQFKWLLLFAFTTSISIGARAGNQLDIFTGEAQAQEVLESQHTASQPEPSPTPTDSPSVVGQNKAPLATPTVPSEELGSPAYPTSTPMPAVEAVDLTGGAGELEEIVERVFGDKANEAKLIVGCESRWNPQTVGDTHIMTYHSGELVGDSIGLFQIRTGGSDFNRAKANGMTAFVISISILFALAIILDLLMRPLKTKPVKKPMRTDTTRT